MSKTLGQLVGEIRNKLNGFGATEDIQTELAAGITSSDLTITVDDSTSASPGVIEIDFELIRVRSASTDGDLTIPTYGRGYKGTTAAAHTAGAEVTISPLTPKSTIALTINEVINELYPELYVVTSTETTVPSNGDPITLTDAIGVISVFLEPTSAPGTWLRMDSWTYEPDADGSLYLGLGTYGQAVRVVYATKPATFDLTGSTSQDWETVTGFPERIADLLALGVAAKLAPMVALNRNRVAGAEARAESSNHPADYSGYIAKLTYSEFKAKVQAEKDALVREHPIRTHKVAR